MAALIAAHAAAVAAKRLLLPRHAGGLAAQRGGLPGAVPLADGLLFGEPSQPRCALCALTWLGLGARPFRTPPPECQAVRAEQGPGAAADMTDPQGLAWRVLPWAAPRPTAADTRGGGSRRHESGTQPRRGAGRPGRQVSLCRIRGVGGLAPGRSVGPDSPARGRDGSLGLATQGFSPGSAGRDRRGRLYAPGAPDDAVGRASLSPHRAAGWGQTRPAVGGGAAPSFDLPEVSPTEGRGRQAPVQGRLRGQLRCIARCAACSRRSCRADVATQVNGRRLRLGAARSVQALAGHAANAVCDRRPYARHTRRLQRGAVQALRRGLRRRCGGEFGAGGLDRCSERP